MNASLQMGPLLQRLSADSPRFTPLALLLTLGMVPVLGALVLDERLFQGVNVWVKPLKFQFALAVYLLTLAWFARFAQAQTRQARGWVLHEQAVVWAITVEMLWIGGAAAHGTASHFNQSSLAMGAIYGFMGVAAILLTTASTTLAVAIHRNPQTGLSPLVKAGLVWGLGMTLPLTLVTAGTMSAQSGHLVGSAGSGVAASAYSLPGLALMGWSRELGDLRVSHFFATHAMHVVPLAAWGWARLWGGQRRWPILPIALAYGGFVVVTFVQGLMGRPFL